MKQLDDEIADNSPLARTAKRARAEHVNRVTVKETTEYGIRVANETIATIERFVNHLKSIKTNKKKLSAKAARALINETHRIAGLQVSIEDYFRSIT